MFYDYYLIYYTTLSLSLSLQKDVHHAVRNISGTTDESVGAEPRCEIQVADIAGRSKTLDHNVSLLQTTQLFIICQKCPFD